MAGFGRDTGLRDSGILGFWGFGVLGLQDYWINHFWDYRIVELIKGMGLRNSGLWDFEILGFGTTGYRDHRILEGCDLGFRTMGLRDMGRMELRDSGFGTMGRMELFRDYETTGLWDLGGCVGLCSHMPT